MSIDRRAFLAVSAAAAATPSRLLAQAAVLRPEHFGARGDGVTNDTRAFADLSAEVNRRGGGTIALTAGSTYIVGEQSRGRAEMGWTPQPVLDLHDLAAPLRIAGNGARLRCQPGLRFGTFDLATDQAVRHAMPNVRRVDLASPYRGLIRVRKCRAPIAIRDVELDGNVQRLRIGGQYGDKGWQVPATGLLLEGNLSEEIIENIYSHHHALDGAMIIGDPHRSARSRIDRLIARYNARQGLSLTGGRGYDFTDCEFSHTGRAGLSSAPGAGVDIEAEYLPIRDVSFTRCKFIDNTGAGMTADSGDSEGARFSNCLFVGTTSWSAWPNKPRFRFSGCTFVGSVVHPFPDADPVRAAHFTDCRFTDDPKLSPGGKVYVDGGPIVNLAESDNVLFDTCKFDVVSAGVLPWSSRATYKDCTMSQRSPKAAMTKGKYLGRTTIHGPVDLYGSMVIGTLIVNGRQIPRGIIGNDVRPW
jgi:hypothetical protein